MSVNMSAPSPVYNNQQPQTASGSYYPGSAIPQTAPPMYGEDDVPMSVQLQHQGLSTPLQMIATPMPQMPGGNWNFQSHSQNHSQVQTPMPGSMTPAPMDNGMLNVDQSGSIIPAAGGSGSPEEEDEDDDEELKERERSSSAEESAEE
jgi:hypothetical protein